jgi:hypothetical protein
MVSNARKSKVNQETKEETIRTRDKIPEDFMPYWKREEECFKQAVITDPETKRKTTDTFPRPIPANQRVYESWLEKVVNPSTGDYYPQRDQDGAPIKGTGAPLCHKTYCKNQGRQE